jgi:hypothetical protein
VVGLGDVRVGAGGEQQPGQLGARLRRGEGERVFAGRCGPVDGGAERDELGCERAGRRSDSGVEQGAAFDAAQLRVDVQVVPPVADNAAQAKGADGGERVLRVDEVDGVRPVQGVAVDATEPRAESGAGAAGRMQKLSRLAVQLVIDVGFTQAADIIWPMLINME